MSPQNTRLQNIVSKISTSLSSPFTGPWKRRSIGIISLLSGYWLSSNLASYFVNKQGQRLWVLIIMLLIIELLVRLRSNQRLFNSSFQSFAIDNIRIGSTYAIVLEAFKLGS